MNKSDAIELVAEALALAQAEMQNPSFDKVNPHLKNQYASLKSVRDTVMPVFNKHGISILQLVKAEGDRAGCENIILHKSGQWISETTMLPVDKMSPQGAGSASTYARRYALQAIAGVVGETDDDGEGANKKPKTNVNQDPKGLLKDLTPTASNATTGIFESLPEARQKALLAIADTIKRQIGNGEDWNAYDTYIGAVDPEEQDEWAALRSLLPSHVKTALKKMMAEEDAKQKQLEKA